MIAICFSLRLKRLPILASQDDREAIRPPNCTNELVLTTNLLNSAANFCVYNDIRMLISFLDCKLWTRIAQIQRLQRVTFAKKLGRGKKSESNISFPIFIPTYPYPYVRCQLWSGSHVSGNNLHGDWRTVLALPERMPNFRPRSSSPIPNPQPSVSIHGQQICVKIKQFKTIGPNFIHCRILTPL